VVPKKTFLKTRFRNLKKKLNLKKAEKLLRATNIPPNAPPTLLLYFKSVTLSVNQWGDPGMPGERVL
jgi:hypothetical protein